MTHIEKPSFRSMTKLPSPLEQGDSVQVYGRVPEDAEGFSINLTTGPGVVGAVDCPLHVNPRFGEGDVVRNSLLGGDWGDEERNGDFTFTQGRDFEMTIMAREDDFVVSVDGRRIFHFGYRSPLNAITHVVIEGDMDVKEISFHDKTSPSMMRSMYQRHDAPDFQLSVPYEAFIPSGLFPQRVITVSGRLPDSFDKFDINLMNHETRQENIALHFNPRQGENVVVRNSMADDDWRDEERDQDFFPFSPGAAFTVHIRVTPDVYQIYVNGIHYTDFAHRQRYLEGINFLRVDGDVILHSVSM